VGPGPRKSQMRRPPGVPCKNADIEKEKSLNQPILENKTTSATKTSNNFENNNRLTPIQEQNERSNNNNSTNNDQNNSNNITNNTSINNTSNNNNSLDEQDPERPSSSTSLNSGDYIDNENSNQTIIQWNCNGFYNHFEELKVLIVNENPIVLCLQETHFKALDSPTLRDFSIYHVSDLNRAIHGVAICVKNEISSEEIILNTNLKAVAVRIQTPKEMTICSIYISPRETPSEKDYKHLIDQLPTPFLLAGDFNARSPIWSEENSCTKGKVIEKVLTELDLAVMNTGENTHFSTAYGSYSAIDLSIITPTLFNNLKWHVLADLCSSDHYPIVITFLTNQFTKKKMRRWKIKQADWTNFQDDIDDSILQKNPSSIQEMTKIIVRAATKFIPKTGDKLKRPQVPWWSPEIKDWIRKRRKAERKYKKTKSNEDLGAFRMLRAKVKYLIKKAKREKWREYVDTITTQTNPSSVWNKIGNISGKRKFNGISGMTDGQNVTCDPQEIANILGEHFERVSSSENYEKEFLQIKARNEMNQLEIIDDDTEPYNLPFTYKELEDALQTCTGSSPGNDEIHYQMLKNLSVVAKKNLLDLYNFTWISGTFPEEWTEAIIIPIAKPGKDPKMPNSYRPISLTSCVCKLMEKMVNKRLTWFLEKNGFLSEYQFGFRKNRSTADCTVILESEIQKAFEKKEHLVAVSCDLEKAYDTAWRRGILENLKKIKLKGKLMFYLKNFTNSRTFRVLVGNTFSKQFFQENGVVQGAVISVNLFLVAINQITSCIQEPIKIVGFADDWTLYLRHHNLEFIQETMQKALNNLTTWSNENGFRFSSEKTVVMHFHRLRPRINPIVKPKFKLNGQWLKITETHKILGLMFDSKLDWKCQMNYIKEKVNKRMNLIKALSGLKWGADQDVLLRIHQTMILSVIEYGIATYSSAKTSTLKTLNTLHNQGIRLALGAFRSSRIENLLCEAGMASLEQRRELLTTQTAIRVAANKNHPLKTSIINTAEVNKFIARPKITKPFYIRAQLSTKNLDINLDDVWEIEHQQHAPWVRGRFTLDTSMQKFEKDNNDRVIQSEFLEMQQNRFQHLTPIFTDGSKMAEKTGCGIITPAESITIRLPNHTSIYTAELYALLHALDWNTNQENSEDVAVYTDSLSSIQALENLYLTNHPLTVLIKDKLNDPRRENYAAIIWTPGHRGIQGNEKADEAAKLALGQDVEPHIKIPAKDLISKARLNFKKIQQQLWNATENPMHSIKKSIKRWKPAKQFSRHDQVVLSRIRIGHTRLTHKYHMEHQEKPTCEDCEVHLTIQHVIFECPRFEDSRRFFNISRKSLGNNETENSNLISFLKKIQIYKEI